MENKHPSAGKYIAIAAVVLALLHHDFWFWNDKTLVFGFMPIGLLYHAIYSLIAGLLWWCAVKFAWPHDVEAWADEFDEKPTPTGTPAPTSTTNNAGGDA